jgi:uncharacterized protein
MPLTPDGVESRADASHAGLLSRLRCRLDRLAHMDDDPKRIATALALGVFLSFSPFLGFQVLIGLGAAFLLRLSRVAVLIGLCANLPWIMLPWYVVTTASAAALFGLTADVDIAPRVAALLDVPFYRPAFWSHTRDLITALFWPFLVGPTTGALVLGAIAYVVGLRFLSRRFHRRHPAGPTLSTGPAGDAEERAANRHVHDAQRARLQP